MSKPNLVDLLQPLWDGGQLHPHSSPATLLEEATKLDPDHGYDADWFEEMAPWLKDRLGEKKRKRIEEAVQVLFDEVNSGREKLVVEPIGRQHKYLLDRFAWMVLQAINEYARIPGSDDFDGRISPALQKVVREGFVAPKR